jgi:error-prone DNA polymerase
VPIGNAAMDDRTFIEWDKDDIDALGLMKVDVLALGMLTCIRKSFDLMRRVWALAISLRCAASDDPAVYDMLCKGDSLGVFQVESRAQMNMLPRLRPREFYDLVIEVAIVRPGPIQGDMVHPYLRRREGTEKVEYPSPIPPHDPDELRGVLGRTYGVPLFQEQAMKLAIVAANFSPDEANGLRRAMATFRNVGTITASSGRWSRAWSRAATSQPSPQRCFRQIKGFGSYGFPESHARALRKLVYVSSWLKCHQPGRFACALLNSQPMGFYAPGADRARRARAWRGGAAGRCQRQRLGQHAGKEREWQISSAPRLSPGGWLPRQQWALAIAAARGWPIATSRKSARRGPAATGMLRLLADADAFGSLAPDRREALWEVRRMPDDELLPLFAAARAAELGVEPDSPAGYGPGRSMWRRITRRRPVAEGAPDDDTASGCSAEQAMPCAALRDAEEGANVRVAGVVLVRQRPGKGNAIFITLEDETGIANIVLWARQFEIMRRAVMAARIMLVEGVLQVSKEGVVHVMASRILDRSEMLAHLSEIYAAAPRLSPADAFVHPQHPRTPPVDAGHRHPRNVRLLPKSRDFH